MTDEAPALATVSLLPIIQAYSKSSDIKFEEAVTKILEILNKR